MANLVVFTGCSQYYNSNAGQITSLNFLDQVPVTYFICILSENKSVQKSCEAGTRGSSVQEPEPPILEWLRSQFLGQLRLHLLGQQKIKALFLLNMN